VTGVILAGGRSRRLGIDKTKLPWPPKHLDTQATSDTTLLQITADRLAIECDDVILVGYRDKGNPLRYRTVPDVYTESGSLGGIYSGLSASDGWVFVVGADMPFLNLALVRHMLSLERKWDALIPLVMGKPEPLHGLYGQACLPTMHDQIEAGELKISNSLDKIRAHYLQEHHVRCFDPDLLSFFNINTPADLERARAIQLEAQEPQLG